MKLEIQDSTEFIRSLIWGLRESGSLTDDGGPAPTAAALNVIMQCAAYYGSPNEEEASVKLRQITREVVADIRAQEVRDQTRPKEK